MSLLGRLEDLSLSDIIQIVYLARHFAGPGWKTLTIPKGESAKFTKGDFKEKGIAR